MRVLETRVHRQVLNVVTTPHHTHTINLPVNADNTSIYVRINSIDCFVTRVDSSPILNSINEKFEIYASGCYTPLIGESDEMEEHLNVINHSVIGAYKDVYALSTVLGETPLRKIGLSWDTYNKDLSNSEVGALLRGDVSTGLVTLKLITDSTVNTGCVIQINYSRMLLTQQEVQLLLERLPNCCC